MSKPRMDLIPLRALWGVAEVLDQGGQKPGRQHWDWLDNATEGRCDDRLAAALRHLSDVVEDGLSTEDEDSGLMSLDHAIADLLMVRRMFEKLVDDRLDNYMSQRTNWPSDYDFRVFHYPPPGVPVVIVTDDKGQEWEQLPLPFADAPAPQASTPLPIDDINGPWYHDILSPGRASE